DWLMRAADPQSGGIDRDGRLAARGAVDDAIVQAVLAEPFFACPPPRSTDGPEMIALFQRHARGRLEDQLATACRITARSLAQAMTRYLPAAADQVILSGGGVRNPVLMDHLRQELGPVAL